jgi:hypothetical protein
MYVQETYIIIDSSFYTYLLGGGSLLGGLLRWSLGHVGNNNQEEMKQSKCGI